jgi:hypothetical protein
MWRGLQNLRCTEAHIDHGLQDLRPVLPVSVLGRETGKEHTETILCQSCACRGHPVGVKERLSSASLSAQEKSITAFPPRFLHVALSSGHYRSPQSPGCCQQAFQGL